jgi:hypothetical protein
VPAFGPRNSASAQDTIEEMPQLMYEAFHLGRVQQIGVLRRPTSDSDTTQQNIAMGHTSIDAYRQGPLMTYTPAHRSF